MQKTIYSFILWALAISFFSSCKNELDVTADYKEIAIVYGLLNPTDDVNYIRIQKAYLDEKTGALAFSNIPDSLYFDTLDVSITEFLGGIEGNTYPLRRVDGNKIGLPKDSGIFSNEVNYLYQLNAPVKASSYFNDYEYKLTIFNPITGNIVTSSTLTVGTAEVSAPASEQSKNLVILSDSNFKVVALYKEGKYARAYDMIMRIKVEEINTEDTTQRETLELDWVMFSDRKTRSLRGFEETAYGVPATLFFNFLKANLDSTKNVNRRLLGFDLFTYGIGDDLNTYISVNEPSIGIVQKKPEYTNIQNGFGIFSSRHINKLFNKTYDFRTRQAVRTSDITSHLNFLSY